MKKEKIKKVLKNRIFIFVMSAILFSVVGVSAATYFESGAVTILKVEQLLMIIPKVVLLQQMSKEL